MKTKTHLINSFYASHLINSAATDEICIISDNNEVDAPRKGGIYLRQVVSLHGKQFVVVPRNDPMERLAKFGILPRSKYTFDVYLQIAYLAGQERSLDYIVEYMRKDFLAIDEAHLCRKFVKRVLMLTSAVFTPFLPEVAPLGKPWNLIIDGTVRTSGNSTLIVVLAHFPDDNSTFPLLATFIPSENKQDLVKILLELKQRLPSDPQAVISDFSRGFLSSLPVVFPDSASLGCHFHAIELIARILVNPTQKKLNRMLKEFLNKLKSEIRKILHRQKNHHALRSISRTLKIIVSKHQGDFGRNTISMFEQLKAVQDCFVENKDILKEEYQTLRKLFNRQKWTEIENYAQQLKNKLRDFDELRNCLRPENNYSSASMAEYVLNNLISSWERKDSETQKAAETLKKLIPYLIPAMCNPKYPRTTSILEGLNNQVKRVMRHWCGTQQLPLSFEWVGELLSVICGINDLTLWSDILTQIPLRTWIEKLIILRAFEKQKRMEIRSARWMAGLQPASLHRQIGLTIKRDLMKEVMS